MEPREPDAEAITAREAEEPEVDRHAKDESLVDCDFLTTAMDAGSHRAGVAGKIGARKRKHN